MTSIPILLIFNTALRYTTASNRCHHRLWATGPWQTVFVRAALAEEENPLKKKYNLGNASSHIP